MMKKRSSPNRSMRRQPRQVNFSKLLALIAVTSLVSSLLFLVITTVRLNQTDIPPQEGQLLNRISIEQAAQLLQEQTVVFNEQ